jgi:hypothetical protein
VFVVHSNAVRQDLLQAFFGRARSADYHSRSLIPASYAVQLCFSLAGAARCEVLMVYSTVSTTFPRACPSSRYRSASGVSLSL